MGLLGNVGSFIFGGGDDPGLLGTGRFKPTEYNIDPNAFVNRYANQNQADLSQALAGTRDRQATLEADPFRQQQLSLANALAAQSRGEGPSLAQNQLQQGMDRNIANQYALMASNRGISPGMAGRVASQNIGNIGAQMGAEAANLRLQEQLGAQGQLGNVLGQGRQGELGATTAQADLEKFYQNALLAQQERERQAMIERQRLGVEQSGAMNAARGSAYNQAAQSRGRLLTAIGGGLALGAMSKK